MLVRLLEARTVLDKCRDVLELVPPSKVCEAKPEGNIPFRREHGRLQQAAVELGR